MMKPQKQKFENSLADFLAAYRDEGDPNSAFEKVSERVLRVDIDGSAWINLGSAIGYYGDLKFERIPVLKTKNLKKSALHEITRLVRAHGKGRLYCAHAGWHVSTLRLANETLMVSANEVLAFEDTLDFEMCTVGKGISITSGGVLALKVSGEGWMSLAVHGDPLVLPVTPDSPLSTDPHATIAWTDGVTPTIKTDITWRTFVGRGGGEAFQIHFTGDGFVVIQPSEDPRRFSGKWLKKLF